MTKKNLVNKTKEDITMPCAATPTSAASFASYGASCYGDTTPPNPYNPPDHNQIMPYVGSSKSPQPQPTAANRGVFNSATIGMGSVSFGTGACSKTSEVFNRLNNGLCQGLFKGANSQYVNFTPTSVATAAANESTLPFAASVGTPFNRAGGNIPMANNVTSMPVLRSYGAYSTQLNSCM